MMRLTAALAGLILLLSLTGCREPVVAPTLPVSAATTPTLPSPSATAPPPSRLPVPPPAPPTVAPPTDAPATVAPTPAVITIGPAPGVPAVLVAALEQLAAGDERFVWTEERPDVSLTPAPDAQAPFHRHYALVAPFATVPDGLSGAELQAAWQDGRLTMSADTYGELRAVWGAPAVEPPLVAPEALSDALRQASADMDRPALAVVPFDRLEPQQKVLAVDGASPVKPDFAPTGYPLTLGYGLSGPPEIIAELSAAWPGPTTNRDESRMTRVAMTGPAGMRRAVADRMERYGMNYPAEETGPVLQAADIAHMSNENAFAPDCPPPDPLDSENVCNRDEYIALMAWMSIDVNEMTGNHLNDWGPDALLHTFDLYDSYGIATFGGGRDLAHAGEPLLIEHNGNRLAFVGCNPVGPPAGWATESRPGALPCDDYAALKEQIAALARQGYQVIATLQYLEDYQYAVLDAQRQAFDALAEAGATVVSGSHAHHPQGFSFPGGRFVHYGLGNLLADQMWSLGSRQMFIDTHLFYEGTLLNVDLWTGINEDYARVRAMTPAERAELLRAVFAAGPDG